MGHHCHALGCRIAVPPERLMCRHHWAMGATQRAHRGVDGLPAWPVRRQAPSEAWLLAANAAVGAVAQIEGKPLSQAQQHALNAFEERAGPR